MLNWRTFVICTTWHRNSLFACWCLLDQRRQQHALELDLGTQRPTDLLAAVNNLLPQPIIVDPQLLPQVAQSPSQTLILRNGNIQTLAQALLVSLDCWWAELPNGRIVLSRDQQVMSQAWLEQPHKRRVATTALIHQDLIAEEIRMLLDPWLAPPHGIAYHPPLGRFSLNLTDQGRDFTTHLLSVIDRIETILPDFIPHPSEVCITSELRSPAQTDWPAWGRWLSAAMKTSVILSSELVQRKTKPPQADQLSVRSLMPPGFGLNNYQRYGIWTSAHLHAQT